MEFSFQAKGPCHLFAEVVADQTSSVKVPLALLDA